MRVMVLRDKALLLEEVPLPEPGPMQVLARVRACGICGSDLHAARFLDDWIAGVKASGASAAATFEPSDGMVMGHELVADVVRAGPGAEQWEPGTRVTSMPVLLSPGAFHSIGYSLDAPGGYGEYLLLSAPLLLRVPGHLPDHVAATTEPCAVGLHAVRQAKIQPAEHALVMGAGPIGLMTLLWLKKSGVRHVTVTDFATPRRDLAARLGADLVIDPREADVTRAITEAAGSPPPVVFECVGVEGTLQEAIDVVARQGRIIVVGVCMRPDSIRPMAGITKHVTLQFVLGYSADEYAEALAALADGSIDTAPMVTRNVTLDELPATFLSLANPRDCKVVLTFGP